MKKVLALSLLASVVLPIAGRANVHIDLQAGNLKSDSTGTTAAPLGSLLMIIASGADLAFQNTTPDTPLAAGQYVTGDDTVVAAMAINNNFDNSGTIATSNVASITVAAGQYLAIRWFPSILFSSYTGPSSPLTLNNMYYGTFAGATAGAPNGGDARVVPSDGNSIALNMVTVSLNASLGYPLGTPGDAVANTAGYASVKIGVPEPGTLGLLGAGLTALLAVRRRRE